jgi:hypothetical protein
VWDVSNGRCLAVLSDHQSPVVALQTMGNVLVSLAPGEGVLVHVYERAQDGSKHETEETLSRVGSSGAAHRRAGANGRVRSLVAELHNNIAGSRTSNEESCFRNTLSMLEGAAGLTFQAAATLDVACLVLGSATGDVLLLDYGDTKRRRRHRRN